MFLLHDILFAVSQTTRVSVWKLRGDARGADHVSNARGIAMYLCRELTEESTGAIGQFFKRDHSTVITQSRKVAGRMEEHPAFSALVHDIELAIVGRGARYAA